MKLNATNFSIDKLYLNILWTLYYDKHNSGPHFQVCISFFSYLLSTKHYQKKENIFTTKGWAPHTEYLRQIWSIDESVAPAGRKHG